MVAALPMLGSFSTFSESSKLSRVDALPVQSIGYFSTAILNSTVVWQFGALLLIIHGAWACHHVTDLLLHVFILLYGRARFAQPLSSRLAHHLAQAKIRPKTLIFRTPTASK